MTACLPLACVDLTLPEDQGGPVDPGVNNDGGWPVVDLGSDPDPIDFPPLGTGGAGASDGSGGAAGGGGAPSTLGNGLVAYWPLDERQGGRFEDQTGRTGPGWTLNGTAWQTVDLPGPLGAGDRSALRFDGVNDYATMGTSGIPDNGSTRSLSLWFNLGADAARQQDFISLTDGTATALNLGVRNSLLVAASWGGAVLASVSAPPPGRWHHLGYSWDGRVNRLYLDGALMAQGAATQQKGQVREAWLGSSRARADFYAGTLDDIRIYGRLLGDNEMAALAAGQGSAPPGGAGGTPDGGAPDVPAASPIRNLVGYWKLDESSTGTPFADSSGNQIAAKAVRAPVPDSGVPGLSFPNPHSQTFAGNQCAIIGNPAVLNFSGAITLSAWVNVSARGGTRNVVAHGPSDTDVGLRLEGNLYSIYAASGSTVHRATFSIPSDDNATWVHLAGSYDGTTWRVFRNGHQVGATVDDVGALVGRGNWAIGSTGSCDDRFFRGGIDDVRIYHADLNADELRRITAGAE